MIKRAAALSLAAACLAGIAGCGGGGSKAPISGPATIVPAAAPLYFESVIEPQGDQKAAVDHLAGRILGTSDPTSKVESLLDKAIGQSDPGLSYTKDIKPWLGQRAGVFFPKFAGPGRSADGVLVLEVTDPAAALAANAKSDKAEHLTESKRQYKGVDYVTTTDGATGIVRGYMVAGPEAGFKAAVDTTPTTSLAHSARFADAVDSLPDDRLATGYLDPVRLTDELVKEGQATEAQIATARRALGNTAKEPALFSSSVRDDALLVDFSVAPPTPASRLGLPGSALGDLPADAWLAFGFRNAGERIKRAIEQSDALGAAVAKLQKRAEGQAAIDFNRDLLSWLGDASFFIEGASKQTFQMALVLGTTDTKASEAAIHDLFGPITPKLTLPGGGTGLTIPPMPQLPGRPMHVVQRDNKLVIAVGDQAGQGAFSPAKKLSDDAGFKQAGTALGGFSAVAYFAVPRALPFIEQFVKPQDVANYQMAKPYLEKLGFAALGTKSSGDRDFFRLAVGLVPK